MAGLKKIQIESWLVSKEKVRKGLIAPFSGHEAQQRTFFQDLNYQDTSVDRIDTEALLAQYILP